MNVEFSRLVGRDKLTEAGLAEAGSLHEIEADAEERLALARRLGLTTLDSLRARIAVTPSDGGALIRLSGRLEADLVQACVVTLEPVRNRIVEDFEQLFSLAADRPPSETEVMVAPDEDDPPEPVGPDGIDIGELVAQQLAVAIDPYPRADGASLEALREAGLAGEGAVEGPFAALRALKQGDGRNGANET